MAEPAQVTFHPGMRSGEPTIGGTRLALWFILPVVWSDGVQSAMGLWQLTREQVLVACWFAGTYGVEGFDSKRRRVTGRFWQKRWGGWALEHHGAMWAGKFDKVPDPPDRT
jgi:uncharacterized protein (DUF433 family)